MSRTDCKNHHFWHRGDQRQDCPKPVTSEGQQSQLENSRSLWTTCYWQKADYELGSDSSQLCLLIFTQTVTQVWAQPNMSGTHSQHSRAQYVTVWYSTGMLSEELSLTLEMDSCTFERSQPSSGLPQCDGRFSSQCCCKGLVLVQL